MGSVAWPIIDVVLLDMDGTLLDKHFDDHFWDELVPERFSVVKGISLAEAKDKAYAAYRAAEGTLRWTSLAHWSSWFGFDIVALKKKMSHLVAIHPDVEPFLRFLQKEKKQIVLVTNADPMAVQIKLNKTLLTPYFDAIFCSSDFGAPKEDQSFWVRLEQAVSLEKSRALLIDDTEAVLHAAQCFGIQFILFKTYASSQVTREPSRHFPSISHFSEIFY